MVIQNCHICGMGFYGPLTPAWYNLVRAVYVKGYEWSAPHLTDPSWHIGAHLFSTGQQTIVITGVFPLLEEGDRRDPLPYGPSSYWGFYFHDSCWSLLKHASHPADVDLKTLLPILRSFPPFGYVDITHPAINWGHDYGGLVDLQYNPDWLPRGALNLPLQIPIVSGVQSPICMSDPVRFPWTRHVLRGFIKERYNGETSAQAVNATLEEGLDCFTALGSDIRQLLLTHLDSKDVMNLFLVSKVMANTPLSQAFWKSRFEDGREFSYLFEILNHKLTNPGRHYRDWRTLYHNLITTPFISEQAKRSYQNRVRLWPLVKELGRVLALLSGSEPQGEPCAAYWDKRANKNVPIDTMKWQSLCGNYRDNPVHGDKPLVFLKREARLQALFSRKVKLSDSKVIGVNVHFLTFHNVEYVTGLAFHQEDGTIVKLGYIIKGRDSYLELAPGEDLWGFYAALGWKGLYALMIVTGQCSFHLSGWAGKPWGFFHKALVAKRGPVRQVKAHFDGLSMVALDILEGA